MHRGEIIAAKTLEENLQGVRNMQFNLMGFDQDAGVRLYAFRGIAPGTCTNFTVAVDLALLPSYGIQIQELPLLCRELLQRQVEGQEERALTLSEKEMRTYADARAATRAAAAQRKKPMRRPPSDSVGSAWRAQVR